MLSPGVRGVALIEAVIAQVEAGKSKLEIHQLRPAPPEKLAGLPASLARWLAYDTSWVMRTCRWFTRPEAPAIATHRLSELVSTNLHAEGAGEIIDDLERRFLPAPCALVSVGADSMHFYYLGAADSYAEHPVLVFDVDDAPVVEIAYPGFDVFLACTSGLCAVKSYKAAIAEQAHLYLEGKLFQEHLGKWTGRKVARPKALPPLEAAPIAAKKTRRKGPLLPGERPKTEAQVAGLVAEAAAVGDRERLEEMMRLAKEISPKGAWQAGAMRHACMYGNTRLARALLDAGMAVDARDAEGWQALHIVALNGHTAIAELLLDRGASVDARSNRGETPLIMAASQQHAPMVRLLLRRGAAVGALDENGWTALHMCAQRTVPLVEAEALNALLEGGADANQRLWDKTPLIWAADAGSLSAVRLLVERGADPNALGNPAFRNEQVPPLHISARKLNTGAQREDAQILRYLVTHGADRALAGLAGSLDAEGRFVFGIVIESMAEKVVVEATLVGHTSDRVAVKTMRALVKSLGCQMVKPPEFEMGTSYSWTLSGFTAAMVQPLADGLRAACEDGKPLVRLVFRATA